jgi:hypothetical protein
MTVVDTKGCRLHKRRRQDVEDLLEARDEDAVWPELSKRCVELRTKVRGEVMQFVCKLKREVGKGLAGDFSFVEEVLERRREVERRYGGAIRAVVGEGSGALFDVASCGKHARRGRRCKGCLEAWATKMDLFSMLAVVEPAMCGETCESTFSRVRLDFCLIFIVIFVSAPL